MCELAEAIEGHREGKRLKENIDAYRFWIGPSPDESFVALFKANIKDTVEDELADTVIRLLDYCNGYNYQLFERRVDKGSTGNFSEDVFRLMHYVMQAYHHAPDKDWGYVLSAIIKFCDWHNIELLQHVEWKLRYNATRPHKHGKAY